MVDGVALPHFAVVDLETSGLSARWHRILQIGLVTVDADGVVGERWSTYVKLRWPLQRVGPTHIHGITKSMLKGAPSLDAALDELGRRIDGAVLTAHNARFDGAFLDRAVRRRPPDDPLRVALDAQLCTLAMSRRLDPDHHESHRLGDVCARYGVDHSDPHDALADATATAAILPHLLAAHHIADRAQLSAFFR